MIKPKWSYLSFNFHSSLHVLQSGRSNICHCRTTVAVFLSLNRIPAISNTQQKSSSFSIYVCQNLKFIECMDQLDRYTHNTAFILALCTTMIICNDLHALSDTLCTISRFCRKNVTVRSEHQYSFSAPNHSLTLTPAYTNIAVIKCLGEMINLVF